MSLQNDVEASAVAIPTPIIPTISVPTPTIPPVSAPTPTVPTFSEPPPINRESESTSPAEPAPTITQSESTSPVVQTVKAATTTKDVAEDTTTDASRKAPQTVVANHISQSSRRQTTTTTEQTTVAGTTSSPRTFSSSLYTSISQSSTSNSSNALPSPSRFSASPEVALVSSSTLATSTITPNSRFPAGGNKTSSIRMSVPGVTATAASSVKVHEPLPPGTKAAIALGAFVLALMVAVVASLFWRRHRLRKREPPLSYSAPPERHSRVSTSALPPSYSKMFDKGLPALDEQHPTTVWGSKNRHEMRLAATPRYNLWAPAATSLNPAELDGGWAASEIDGRPK